MSVSRELDWVVPIGATPARRFRVLRRGGGAYDLTGATLTWRLTDGRRGPVLLTRALVLTVPTAGEATLTLQGNEVTGMVGGRLLAWELWLSRSGTERRLGEGLLLVES